MVSLVLVDALMQHNAQCGMFPPDALESLETNPLGKKTPLRVGENQLT